MKKRTECHAPMSGGLNLQPDPVRASDEIIGSPGGATGSEPTAQKMRKHFFVTEASVESIESQ